MRIVPMHRMIDWSGPRWFGLSPWSWIVYVRQEGPGVLVVPWNLFRRDSSEALCWGVGLLQIGKRHLFYVGHDGISFLFVSQSGRIRQKPTRTF